MDWIASQLGDKTANARKWVSSHLLRFAGEGGHTRGPCPPSANLPLLQARSASDSDSIPNKLQPAVEQTSLHAISIQFRKPLERPTFTLHESFSIQLRQPLQITVLLQF
jgi:hypothetical protein